MTLSNNVRADLLHKNIKTRYLPPEFSYRFVKSELFYTYLG